MTCEVAVMNKYALVIAADSAVTTSSGNGAARYSKGGNKIFQLSRFEPVGVMIYGSAMLDGVPWEIIIKNFRDTLELTKHPTLQDYATAFFNFVKTADFFFPQVDRDSKLFDRVLRIAIDFIVEAAGETIVGDNTRAVDERRSAWSRFVQTKIKALDEQPLHEGVTAGALGSAISELTHKVQNYDSFLGYLEEEKLEEIVDIPSLIELSCKYFFKTFDKVLGRTGIVFSGFGEDQHFPAVIQYDVYGFVKDEFLYTKDPNNSCEIGHDLPSGIFQFAMTSSIDTFTTGVGLDTYSEVNKAYLASAAKLVGEVLQECDITEIPANFGATLQQSSEEFSKGWITKMFAAHYHPMKKVIASLPIQEMVHLAETLIVLQSLKERVTTHSESVGGPIDIAVITKSEGLVWIKRKHYFEADRNLPYVMRQRALYEEKSHED
jgi:hypothetical protein